MGILSEIVWLLVWKLPWNQPKYSHSQLILPTPGMVPNSLWSACDDLFVKILTTRILVSISSVEWLKKKLEIKTVVVYMSCIFPVKLKLWCLEIWDLCYTWVPEIFFGPQRACRENPATGRTYCSHQSFLFSLPDLDSSDVGVSLEWRQLSKECSLFDRLSSTCKLPPHARTLSLIHCISTFDTRTSKGWNQWLNYDSGIQGVETNIYIYIYLETQLTNWTSGYCSGSNLRKCHAQCQRCWQLRQFTKTFIHFYSGSTGEQWDLLLPSFIPCYHAMHSHALFFRVAGFVLLWIHCWTVPASACIERVQLHNNDDNNDCNLAHQGWDSELLDSRGIWNYWFDVYEQKCQLGRMHCPEICMGFDMFAEEKHAGALVQNEGWQEVCRVYPHVRQTLSQEVPRFFSYMSTILDFYSWPFDACLAVSNVLLSIGILSLWWSWACLLLKKLDEGLMVLNLVYRWMSWRRLTLHDATEYSGINISRIFLLVFVSHHSHIFTSCSIYFMTIFWKCIVVFVLHKLSMLLGWEAGEPLVRSSN